MYCIVLYLQNRPCDGDESVEDEGGWEEAEQHGEEKHPQEQLRHLVLARIHTITEDVLFLASEKFPKTERCECQRSYENKIS